MESINYENLDEVSKLLQSIFSGTNENVQIATKVMYDLSSHPVPFANALLNIMKSEGTDETTEKVKLAASTSITRIFLEIMKSRKLSFEERVEISQSAILALFSPYTNLQTKVSLQYFLMIIYSCERGEELMREGLQYSAEKLKDNAVGQYPAALFLLQAIINCPLNGQEQVAQCFQEFSEALVSVGGGLVQGILQEFNSFGKDATQETLAKICSGVRILTIWVKAIADFVRLLTAVQKEIKLPNSVFLTVMANNEKLAPVLLAVLMLTSPRGKQIEDCLVSVSGDADLDIILNQLKMNALKVFNKFLDPVIMIDVQKHLKGRDNYFVNNLQQYGLTLVLKTLVLFFRTPELNFDHIHKSQDLSDLLCECFILATRMTIYASLHFLFAEVVKNLVVDVCLPLLTVSEEETRLFEAQPDQFVSYGLDTIIKQHSQTLKSCAARFLTDLCRFLDGAASYTASILFSIVNYSMVPELPEDLVEHADSHMIAQVNPTLRVETCLLAFGVLATTFIQRKDVLKKLENMLEQYRSFFFGPDSHAIIKTRLCLLIPFYTGKILMNPNQDTSFITLLEFLLECAGAEGPGLQALNEQANDSLYTMFEKEHFVDIMDAYVVQILQGLTVHIPTTKTLKLFDTIYEIVTSFEFQVIQHPPSLLQLLTALVERGLKEYEKIRADTEYKKIFLNKIWNVIRGIGEQKKYIKKFQEGIEEVLMPMIDCLEGNVEVDFDEDIMNYMTSAIKISKKVTPAAWKVFKCAPKIFERYQKMLGYMFPALNQIIVFGSEVINSDPDSIRVLVEMGIGALNPTNNSADSANISEGCLFLHLILQYLHPIPAEYMEEILKAAFAKLATAKQKYLRARLGGIFLSAFLKDFEMAQAILSKLEILGDVVDFFLNEIPIFEEYSYDRKLLIIGLSHVLIQPNLDQAIELKFGEIFDVTFSVLRFVRYIEQLEVEEDEEDEDKDVDEDISELRQNLLDSFLTLSGKTDLKEFNDHLQEINVVTLRHEHDENCQHDCPLDNEEEDDDDEESEAARMEKKEAGSTVKAFTTELKMKDEFSVFKNAANIIKENRLPMIQEIVAKLPEVKRAFLIDVLQSQRIPVNEAGPGTARRIVKARQKKIANVTMENGEFVTRGGPSVD